tara:strand:+ start:1404 stop:2018 length:615 start_codon:yes stop_codon:yes gene_type:complete
MELVPYFTQENQPDMTGWYYFEKAFNTEEVEDILKLTEGFPYQAAQIAGKDMDLTEYRKSNIKWISALDSANNSIHRTHWLYDRLMSYMTIANDNLWNFSLRGLTDSIQYTEYHGEEEGFYDWHLDIGPRELSIRKLSLVVQLSDPKDYTGGELQIKTGKYDSVPSKTQGTVIVFPSYLLHRVTPVTSGIRKSLVLWAGGESLK